MSSKSTKCTSSSRPPEPGVKGGEEFDASQGLCGRKSALALGMSPGKTSWLKSDIWYPNLRSAEGGERSFT